MKKILYIVLTLTFLSLISCKAKPFDRTNKIFVACSIFPEYDWTRNVVYTHNDKIILTLIQKNGLDPHNFEPTEQDKSQLSNCHLVIYTGGPSEKWITDELSNISTNTGAQQEGTNPPAVLNLMQTLDPQTLALNNNDEHIHLSLKNAQIFTKAIADALSSLDEQNAADYQKNAQKYIDELGLLDQQFEFAADNATQKNILFADRFPFRYFFTDYNLNCISPFEGCTKQTQADTQTIMLLAEKINEHNIRFVYTIETSDDKLSKAVVQNAHKLDLETIRIDSMQSTTLRSTIEGKTYIGTMQKNMQEFEKGLKLK